MEQHYLISVPFLHAACVPLIGCSGEDAHAETRFQSTGGDVGFPTLAPVVSAVLLLIDGITLT